MCTVSLLPGPQCIYNQTMMLSTCYYSKAYILHILNNSLCTPLMLLLTSRVACSLFLQAFAYLREEVRDFLGQPIRARIKGTTVQRPSAVTKKTTHYPYPSVQNVYNGQQPVGVGWLRFRGTQPNIRNSFPLLVTETVFGSWVVAPLYSCLATSGSLLPFLYPCLCTVLENFVYTHNYMGIMSCSVRDSFSFYSNLSLRQKLVFSLVC